MKAISFISVSYLFAEFGIPDNEQENYIISISGGNFFILLPKKKNSGEIFIKYKKNTSQALSLISLRIILSYTEFDEKQSYGNFLNDLNRKNAIHKLKLFNDSEFTEVFSPFQTFDENLDFKILNLKNRISFSIEPAKSQSLTVRENSIHFLGYKLLLLNNELGRHQLTKSLDTFFPRDSNNETLEFSDLANSFGKTSKLGILKMDVDNLGTFFQNVSDNRKHKKLSELFRYFFEETLSDLVKMNYSNFVYNIISGGDDCFFVGNWKNIIELAIAVNNEFALYWKRNKYSFPNGKIPTISAGGCS